MAETLEVEVWDDDEDATRCIDCGDDIEPGDQMCWEPMREMKSNAVGPAHPWCSVRNGYMIDKPVAR